MGPADVPVGEVLRIDARQAARRVRQVWHAALPAGWLALRSCDQHHLTVTLAEDVATGDVAAVVRHVEERHGAFGFSSCRLPTCDAVLTWRPVATVRDQTTATA